MMGVGSQTGDYSKYWGGGQWAVDSGQWTEVSGQGFFQFSMTEDETTATHRGQATGAGVGGERTASSPGCLTSAAAASGDCVTRWVSPLPRPCTRPKTEKAWDSGQ